MPARTRRALLLVASSLVVLAGLVAGCGGGSSASPDEKPDVKALEVEVSDGTVTPNAERVEVPVGTTVEFTVTSDTADMLHVHGYDKEVDVEPGKPATLELVADKTGRFEVELHENGALVYQLVVTP